MIRFLLVILFACAPTFAQLTIQNDTHGRTSPAGSVVWPVNTTKTIAALANSGHQFYHWTVTSGSATFDDAYSANPKVTLKSTAATIQANFIVRDNGYVTDLPWPSSSTNGQGIIQKDLSNNGNPIKLKNPLDPSGYKTYAKGVGCCASSQIDLQLSGANMFTADIGIDRSDVTTENTGAVIFTVMVDDQIKYVSQLMTSSSAAVPVCVDVTDGKKLSLKVDQYGSNNTTIDHADWANARLVKTNVKIGAVLQGLRFFSSQNWYSAYSTGTLVNLRWEPDGVLNRLHQAGYKYVDSHFQVFYDDFGKFYCDGKDMTNADFTVFRDALIKASAYGLMVIPSISVGTQHGSEEWYKSNNQIKMNRMANVNNTTTWSTPFAEDTLFNTYFAKILIRLRKEYADALPTIKANFENLAKIEKVELTEPKNYLEYVDLNYDENYWVQAPWIAGLTIATDKNGPDYAWIINRMKANNIDAAAAIKMLYGINLYNRTKNVVDVFGPNTRVLASGCMFDPEHSSGGRSYNIINGVKSSGYFIPNFTNPDGSGTRLTLADDNGNYQDVLDFPNSVLTASQISYLKQQLFFYPWQYETNNPDGHVYDASHSFGYFSRKGFDFANWSAYIIPTNSKVLPVNSATMATRYQSQASWYPLHNIGYSAAWYPACDGDCYQRNYDVCFQNGNGCASTPGCKLSESGFVDGWNMSHEFENSYQLADYNIIEYLPSVHPAIPGVQGELETQVCPCDGNLSYCFVRGSDDHIYYRKMIDKQGTWQTCWTKINGPQIKSNIAATIGKNATLIVMAAGTDGYIYMALQDPTTKVFAPMVKAENVYHAPVGNRIAAASDGADWANPDVVLLYRGSDNGLYACPPQSGAGWAECKVVPDSAQMTDSLAACRNPNYGIQVFGSDVSGNIYTCRLSAGNTYGRTNLGPVGNSYANQIAAVTHTGAPLVDVFVVNGNGILFHRYQTGTGIGNCAWSTPWTQLSNASYENLLSPLAVTTNADGREEIFALVNGTVAHIWQTTTAGGIAAPWQAPFSPVGEATFITDATKALGVVKCPSGWLSLFFNNNSAINYTTQNPIGPGGWMNYLAAFGN